jgi:hypothetical protein
MAMLVDWLEMAQRLAAGARAKVAEDRRRLEELQAQRTDSRGASKRPLPVVEPPDSDHPPCPCGLVNTEMFFLDSPRSRL